MTHDQEDANELLASLTHYTPGCLDCDDIDKVAAALTAAREAGAQEERERPQIGTDGELAQRLRNLGRAIDGDGVDLRREVQPALFAAARCIVRLSRQNVAIRSRGEIGR